MTLVLALARRPRATRSAWVLVAIGAALYGVSRTTGAGWLVVLLAGILAALVVGFVLPLVGMRGVDVELRTPTDGTVGVPLRTELVITGRVRDLRVAVPFLDARVAIDAPASGMVEGTAATAGGARPPAPGR